MLTRRRFITIAAAAGALPLAGVRAAGAPTNDAVVWRGSAMGAEASIRIDHPDRALADRLVSRAVAEIDRLEGIFSLYRGDSTLSRLNGAGIVENPPFEFLELMGTSLALARRSGGAFDPTVQPLFRLYADHFGTGGADPDGPSDEAIAAALACVGHEGVVLDEASVRLARRGMAVTLNGIAQGYVTDRIAELLRREGLTSVLVDLGETRAIGRRGDGEPWRAALGNPPDKNGVLLDLPLGDERGAFPALATSAGLGTRFDPAGRHHHIFDPRTGRSAARHLAVAVAAPTAVLADGLSTALSVLSGVAGEALLSLYGPVRAFFVASDGRVSQSAFS
ncbi:FAD:protein FMN transferase [Faunimonas sp. B44]|uniref:FAD:protein FMN transferase n=1 Tax=Faunimonas sp. B44 TaxID=3461493 RepID=UPI0040451720